MPLELEQLNDGRYIIDLGNDNEIEITIDEDDVKVELHHNMQTLWSMSASHDELEDELQSKG